MKILVTGGTGFLGKRLSYCLQAMGHDVTSIGRNENVGVNLRNNGINFIKCDLRDGDAIKLICQYKDFVFHCGALSSPWGNYKDFYDINVNGTRNIIAGCKSGRVRRLIHVSTPSIYFNMEDGFDIVEDAKLPDMPVNYYAKTKRIAEEEVDNAFRQGIPVITVRPRGIFGPGDASIIPRLIRANETFGVPIIEGGQALVDVTYVENVVYALLRCMDSADSTLGKKYNITNGEPMIMIDLLKLIFAKLNLVLKRREISFKKAYALATLMEFLYRALPLKGEPVLTQYTIGVLGKSQTLNIKAARDELGYSPKISIQEGVEEFAKWWRDKLDQ